MTSPTAQYTDFSKDVIGRYVCNGLDEALRSTSGRPDAKPFDVVIVGGGSFGGAAAQHLLYSDTFRNHRILVLEAGPFLFGEHVQNLPAIGLVACRGLGVALAHRRPARFSWPGLLHRGPLGIFRWVVTGAA